MEKRSGTLITELNDGWTEMVFSDGTIYLAHPEHPPEVVYKNAEGEWIREPINVTFPGPGEVILGETGNCHGFWLDDRLAWCSWDPEPPLLISDPPPKPSLLTRIRRFWHAER